MKKLAKTFSLRFSYIFTNIVIQSKMNTKNNDESGTYKIIILYCTMYCNVQFFWHSLQIHLNTIKMLP